jgi:carbon monoxide dehydrogenase subunit G
MAFEIVKTFTVKAPPQAVWDLLVDPQRIAKCLPGAAITGKVDDKTYLGTMTVKVGPVQSSYKGKIVFDKLDAATRNAEIIATGQDIKGRGGADMRMKSTVREINGNETEVTAASTVNITGILAQMGRGMIQDVSDQMFQVFSQRVRAELESAAPAPAPVAADAPAPQTIAQPPQQAAARPQAAIPPVASAPAAAATEALDLGAIGTKVVVRRASRSPLLWFALIVVAAWILYRLIR